MTNTVPKHVRMALILFGTIELLLVFAALNFSPYKSQDRLMDYESGPLTNLRPIWAPEKGETLDTGLFITELVLASGLPTLCCVTYIVVQAMAAQKEQNKNNLVSSLRGKPSESAEEYTDQT
jgi:hypothetical protein